MLFSFFLSQFNNCGLHFLWKKREKQEKCVWFLKKQSMSLGHWWSEVRNLSQNSFFFKNNFSQMFPIFCSPPDKSASLLEIMNSGWTTQEDFPGLCPALHNNFWSVFVSSIKSFYVHEFCNPSPKRRESVDFCCCLFSVFLCFVNCNSYCW